MPMLVYVRLIGFTAGTLLMLFWMVVILGYRRQRNFERVFFFLCLALFLFYGGSLLALNAQLYYAHAPLLLATFAWTVLSLGFVFLPALCVHVHFEYAETRSLIRSTAGKRVWLAAAYAPAIYFGLRAYTLLAVGGSLDFLTPSNSFGRYFEFWFALAAWIAAYWQQRFAQVAPDQRQRYFHRAICVLLLAAGALFLRIEYASTDQAILSTTLALIPILPLAVLVYYAQRFNFLQIGRQHNLLYAVTVTFFALLYLSLVRRVSQWLEPVLPPEASAAILLFLLVVFIEPLQRLLARRLQRTAQKEMDQAQRLVVAIQEVARLGNRETLISFTGDRLKEQLQLADARLVLAGASPAAPFASVADPRWTFPMLRGTSPIGELRVRPHGAMLSGETSAALEFLAEQLPAALELCRLIEEKLRLERELAERERMAALGQMAASISHNLKNPLGSVKTILQLQLENPELPASMQSETRMVLAEISRLSGKLNQLLQFSRPTVLGNAPPFADAASVIRETVAVMTPEAQSRNVAIQVNAPAALVVTAGREALGDIVSNLLVNALDAVSYGGCVNISATQNGAAALVTVEDDGNGIPPDLREKILQPFFTTKTQGTGLGLAIVARRVSESGGKLEFASPVRAGRGTRFSVSLPLHQTQPTPPANEDPHEDHSHRG